MVGILKRILFYIITIISVIDSEKYYLIILFSKAFILVNILDKKTKNNNKYKIIML